MDCCSEGVNPRQFWSAHQIPTGEVTLQSTPGYLFQIGDTAITWQSKKQFCIAIATAEVEYIALAGAAQEATWLRQLRTDLTGSTDCIIINEDNQSAIAIARDPQFHSRVKHINIKYHFIRE